MSDHFDKIFTAVADDLAAKGFAVVDSFLDAPEVMRVLESDEFNEGKLQFKAAGIGKGSEHIIQNEIRGDRIRWIDASLCSAPLRAYMDRVDQLRLVLNRELYLSLKSFEVHLTAYPPGSFYRRHLDQFKSSDRRKISLITYLNKAWKAEEGGQLRMHLPDGPRDFLPEAGRMICFRSDQIEHEVLPAARERLSLTGWLRDAER